MNLEPEGFRLGESHTRSFSVSVRPTTTEAAQRDLRMASRALGDLVRCRKGQPTQQNGVHHAENRGIRADPQGERQDYYRRKAGRLGQSAEGKTHVPGEVLQNSPSPCCAATRYPHHRSVIGNALVRAMTSFSMLSLERPCSQPLCPSVRLLGRMAVPRVQHS